MVSINRLSHGADGLDGRQETVSCDGANSCLILGRWGTSTEFLHTSEPRSPCLKMGVVATL